jgi:Zn-dependent protease with chaperone function
MRKIVLCLLFFSVSCDAGLRQKILKNHIEQMRLQISLSSSTLSAEIETQVKEMVKRLAQKAEIAEPEVYISKLFEENAAVVGDKHASIMVIGQKLVEKLTLRELEGVLGHEIGHLKKDHNFKFWTITTGSLILNFGFAFYLTSKIFNNVSCQQRQNTQFFGDTFRLVFLGLSLPAGAVIKFISRRQEFEADELSVKLAGHKKLIEALEKITPKKEFSSSFERFISWFDKLFSTHPSLTARKNHIEKLVVNN